MLPGNLFSIFVLSKPKLQDCFHQLLIALACFDTTYIIIGGINYTFKAFEASSDAYNISFPFIIYPITNISLCGTIFMTVAISIERFLGICYPLHLPPQNRKSWYYILPVLIFTLAINIPKFLEGEINWIDESPNIKLLDEAEYNHSVDSNETIFNWSETFGFRFTDNSDLLVMIQVQF